MIIGNYVQRFWRYLAVAGTMALLIGAGVFVVESLPPRTIAMATGAEGGANSRIGYPLPRNPGERGGHAAATADIRQPGKSATATRFSVGGKRWIHTRWHHNQQGIAGAGVAGHHILRTAMAFPSR